MISLGSSSQMFVPLPQLPHVIVLVFTVILFRNVVVASPSNTPRPPTNLYCKSNNFSFLELRRIFLIEKYYIISAFKNIT